MYADRGKGYLLDMMKACQLRGKAGETGLSVSTVILLMSLMDRAWGLIGKSSSQHEQAEEVLREAQQVQIQHYLPRLSHRKRHHHCCVLSACCAYSIRP